MDWKLVAADTMDFHRWSYGQVHHEADLYDPRIFGPTEDMACGCGKYRGDHAESGTICESCGVKISNHSELLRRTRLGHMGLLPFTRHPLGGERALIDAFPVAPIAFRIDQNGQPTALGAKYETLWRINGTFEAKLPERGSPDYYRAILDLDRQPLQAALLTIVGSDAMQRDAGHLVIEHGTLFAELFDAIRRLDRSVSALVRALGCTLKISGTI